VELEANIKAKLREEGEESRQYGKMLLIEH